MILTVDIGNTNIKIGAWDKEQLVFISRLHTNVLRTGDEYAISLREIFRLNEYNASQFDGAILSSVVPQLTLPLRDAVRSVIQSKRVYVVSPGLKTGLNIKIDDPSTLGADLVCASVAAIHKYPLPCIIISLGTATAVIAVDKTGAYLGGAFAPGVAISMDALARRTAQLPAISLEKPAGVIGTTTVNSIKAGILYGTADMLDGLVRRMKNEIGQDATVIASGGLAGNIIPYCSEPMVVDDNIVLEGLKIIYTKNDRK